MKASTLVLLSIFLILISLNSDGETLPQTRINPTDGAEMVLIPAGEFLRGTTDAELQAILRQNPTLNPEAFDHERPARRIHLDAYYIDRYEVTVGQYKKFLAATGYAEPDWSLVQHFSPTDDHPITFVSWEDATAYATWAGKSLPTEAQWEKAARGGLEGKLYPWGDALTRNDANYLGVGGRDRWELTTSPVGSFAPNGYGIHDMAGNVIEWVLDWYASDYYQHCPQENPVNLAVSDFRLLRGGAWCFGNYGLRCSYRFLEDPVFGGGDREGFRTVLNLSEARVAVEPAGRLATTWARIKRASEE
jgi:formylglycine-generating enzyme required for sulfatase activity